MIDLKEFRKDLAENLKSLEEKYNLEIKIGNISYGAANFNMKLEALVGTEDTDAAKNYFEASAYSFGVAPSDYGRLFDSNGRTFKLIGFLPKGRKYVFLGEEVYSKRQYKFTREIIPKLYNKEV